MISEIFIYIDNLSSGNQMIAGAISLWLMGTVTYICKEIPKRVFSFCKKHITTELVITSQNNSFYNLLEWFEKNEYADKLRHIKVSNGKYGSSSTTVKSVGYGTHIIWYGFIPLWITLNKEENKSDGDKETIFIVKLGRSHKVFNNLIKDISIKDKKNDRIDIYVDRKGEWRYSCYQPMRSFDSVIVDKEHLERLISSIDVFVKKEKWYVKHGIPYTLGIMLYGPPGTGKSSIIRAIASRMNRSIYIASALGVSTCPEILQGVEENCITVIEDIDSCYSASKRDTRKEDIEKNSAKICFDTSALLNAIDGIVSAHGRVLIMTTNHMDKIDSAVLRPGRCDIKLEIGYFNIDMFIVFMKRFFPDIDFKKMFDGLSLKSNVLTGAILQEQILNKVSCEDIISKFTNKNNKSSTISKNIFKNARRNANMVLANNS